MKRIAPFASCVRVGKTQVFKASNDLGPPALLVPTSFKDPEIRTAAASVAIPFQSAKTEQTAIFRRGPIEDCVTQVNRPLYAANFAFVTYSELGGKIGAFAFRRRSGGWEEEEVLVLGYW